MTDDDRNLRDQARLILSEAKMRRGRPETDTALEISPDLARGVLRLLAERAHLRGDPDPMEGHGADDVYKPDEDEAEE